MSDDAFLGWWLDPGPPFTGPVFLPYRDRSMLLVGPNGHGKSRLLAALTGPAAGRVWSDVPAFLLPYASLLDEILAGSPEAIRIREAAPDRLWSLVEDRGADTSSVKRILERFETDSLQWVLYPASSNGPAFLSAHRLPEPGGEPGSGALVARVQVASRHATAAGEPWVAPGWPSVADLAERTRAGFREWLGHVFAGGGHQLEVLPNVLVGRRPDGTSVALLELAKRFAGTLSARTAERLTRMTGFTVALQCSAEDDFAWYVARGTGREPLGVSSHAIARWVVLSAHESLRELSLWAAGSAQLGTRLSLPAMLAGDTGPGLLPETPVQAFATRTPWLALDEPELHLFPSELATVAAALAEQAAQGRRSVVATHSLQLAANFLGHCDLLIFDGPGRFVPHEPGAGLRELLGRLAADGPGILWRTRVLYVEGHWDRVLLEELFADEFTEANTLIEPVHGVGNASLAASSVWHRLLPVPFGIMFDALRSADVARAWAAIRVSLEEPGDRRAVVRQLRARAAGRTRGPNEEAALDWLFVALVENRQEDRVRFVMHGLSDIFQVMHPSVFSLDAETWAAAGFTAGSFKRFCLESHQIDLTDGSTCRRLVDRFRKLGRPVESAAAERLREELYGFLLAS